ncbi:hypothetical protein FRC18_009182 [Serendipita sp. 400]|nr:hypothetical protein FRC18_009182 [Serendipita sp. 400]
MAIDLSSKSKTDMVSDPESLTHQQIKARVPILLGVMSQCPDALYCEDVFNRVLSYVENIVEMDLTFLAKINVSEPTYGVTCRHGVGECTGNIHELCAIHQTDQTDMAFSLPIVRNRWRKWWDFVMCSNEGGRWEPGKEAVGKECAERVGLQYSGREGLKQCIHGDQGEELLKSSARRTAKLGITNSCTVIIGGKRRCVRDDERWKDCDVPIEEFGEIDGFVKVIREEYGRLNVISQ